MEKRLAGLLGAASMMALGAPASAMPAAPDVHSALQVTSYADLLKPIPNASAVLEAADAAALEQPASAGEAAIVPVQYYHHHHHHHHHAYYRRRYHHHHHHHHHTAARIIDRLIR
jgi:hypothetical protein